MSVSTMTTLLAVLLMSNLASVIIVLYIDDDQKASWIYALNAVINMGILMYLLYQFK